MIDPWHCCKTPMRGEIDLQFFGTSNSNPVNVYELCMDLRMFCICMFMFWVVR